MNELLKELSWSVKLKLLKNTPTGKGIFKTSTTLKSIEDKTIETTTNPTQMEEEGEMARSVDVQKLVKARAGDENPAPSKQSEDDENDMRLKLFRLMYETVRDSDLKVKRAELIREHYTNTTSFEIGYLVGEITDKSNIITDIASTLKRFQREWKPIEHINAYEQIANQAIEINHLIDLVRVVNKRDSGSNPNN